MFVKDVMVQNQVGLHARPATFFIQKANEFKSSTAPMRKPLWKAWLSWYSPASRSNGKRLESTARGRCFFIFRGFPAGSGRQTF